MDLVASKATLEDLEIVGADERYFEFNNQAVRSNGVTIAVLGIAPLTFTPVGFGYAFFLEGAELTFAETRFLVDLGQWMLNESGYQRVETTVESGFLPGHRLSEALGMQPEGVLRRYGPNGADHVMWAWIRDE